VRSFVLPRSGLLSADDREFGRFSRDMTGRFLASACHVPDSRTAATYNEPTVMWRMQRENNLRMHVVIAPTKRGASVMWLVNGRLLGMREFTDWTEAITWSDRIRNQNWTAGWRLIPEDKE
jgi:hypothetical protein